QQPPAAVKIPPPPRELDIFRIALANTLARQDKTNFSEYHDFIRSKATAAEDEVRATAALALGEVGTEQDIPVLENILYEDGITPAIQAGFGLMALGTESAFEVIEQFLVQFADSQYPRDRQVYSIVSSTYEDIKTMQR
ncbi:MAG: HEAT repeat domain-containing protein, partial [Pseudohongiellaceae bacterium]